MTGLRFPAVTEKGTFIFVTMSRPALRPNHSPIHWVSGSLSPGEKRPERQADHLRLPSAEVKVS